MRDNVLESVEAERAAAIEAVYTNRSVTRWREGQMVLRWTAAGMLNVERSFRRIKGHRQMPELIDALRRHANPDKVTDTESVGAAA